MTITDFSGRGGLTSDMIELPLPRDRPGDALFESYSLPVTELFPRPRRGGPLVSRIVFLNVQITDQAVALPAFADHQIRNGLEFVIPLAGDGGAGDRPEVARY